MMRKTAALPGSLCLPDERRGRTSAPHVVHGVDDDTELQKVWSWLVARPLPVQLTRAVDDAVKYVLDGARTGRFDLLSPEVDSDERASVGTKLQYRVLNELGLYKEPPLDTLILGIPVELKATIRSNWMIPTEGQCEISVLIQVDVARRRHRAFLMRVHRVWLNDGANKDGKRGVAADALAQFSLPLIDWTSLPAEPLIQLTAAQLAVVFAPRVGQTSRLASLFGFLPDTVIPRSSIETVCFGNRDPMRRARQAKDAVLAASGLEVLVGTWLTDRLRAKELGFDLGDDAWVAVSPAKAHDRVDVTPAQLEIEWDPQIPGAGS
ncbi:Restriction endonuclease NaeI [Microbacterium sp. ru370.1]|nr:Restriction endonuclease NaeI [Microbacterium sp. ru370.1]SIT76963.1 Restriction endonuclease NaeI [Microbacterium sp. RU1D]